MPFGLWVWIGPGNHAFMYTVSIVFVRWRQCTWRHSAMSYAKTVEPIDLPFGLWTLVGWRKHKFSHIRQVVLSWLSWLTCSRQFTHIRGHPSAAGRAQAGESSPAKDRHSTTVPCSQPLVTDLWLLYLWICLFVVTAMLFEAGIILGAHSEPVAYPVRSGSSHLHWPYLQLERTVNNYLLCFSQMSFCSCVQIVS